MNQWRLDGGVAQIATDNGLIQPGDRAGVKPFPLAKSALSPRCLPGMIAVQISHQGQLNRLQGHRQAGRDQGNRHCRRVKSPSEIFRAVNRVKDHYPLRLAHTEVAGRALL